MTDPQEFEEKPAAPLSPFERWIDQARPRIQIWRTVVGAVMVVAVWAVWTTLAILIASATGLVDADAMLALLGQGGRVVDYWSGLVGSIVVFSTFLGLWLGVWIATGVLHKRKPGSVISSGGGIRLSEFGIGLAIGAVYLAAGFATNFVAGQPPQRTSVELNDWLLGFAPICLLLFFQTAGEELFFRGYLVQQLAARIRHPLVWAFVPAVLFGLGHFANVADPVYAAYYVAATIMFGLVAVACVWRTGSLATAMGLHFINNVAAFTVAGPATGVETQFWVWPDAEVVGGAPFDLAALALMLVFVLSPWAPFPKAQPFARRKEIRAAP